MSASYALRLIVTPFGRWLWDLPGPFKVGRAPELLVSVSGHTVLRGLPFLMMAYGLVYRTSCPIF